METKGFFQFKININVLVSFFDSFEYLCYGSKTIINIFTLTVWGSTLDLTPYFYSVEIDFRPDVYRRQILTSKVDPRVVRVGHVSIQTKCQ